MQVPVAVADGAGVVVAIAFADGDLLEVVQVPLAIVDAAVVVPDLLEVVVVVDHT